MSSLSELRETMGSGVINIHKYLSAYSNGAQPLFEDTREGFRLNLPLSVLSEKTSQTPRPGEKSTGGVAGEVTGEVRRLLEALESNALGRADAQAALKQQSQANFRDRYLVPALDAGLIERTIPDKPDSRLQKYAF